MSTDNNDAAEALVAFVSGALVGAAATLLFVRMKNNRGTGSYTFDDDYFIDGSDLFV